ncbi:Phosphatidylglycerol specific phospholipase C [Mycena indigotica]|uniref:Phosphatidylglycerol specific phospholipase C n=1 Tax=Mycena indigotica TaxID=2126181 RepID=A0A8H6W293_9AGAR|nr:Phosphatidylglycerol specific phospholipase C [Mycena indigotica]KAF7299013.1 Phosphatidylglycerol specific phospholipase C [Mycena indigotica]
MKANTTAAFIGSLLATSMPFARSPEVVDAPPFGYTAGSPASVANMKEKIKHVVWVLLENRSFDNLLGGLNRPGLDNPINVGDVCNPVDVTKPNGATLCTRSKDFDSVLNDPDHSVTGNNFEFYGQFAPDNTAIQNGTLVATNQGFVNKQTISYPSIGSSLAAAQVMGYYSESEIPTIADIVDSFTTFNYWFSCIPGPTNPNRACATSGTSAGHGSNDASFTVAGLTQNNIFQTATAHNISWINYDGTNGAFAPDALFYASVKAHSTANIVPIENFFQDAFLGLLPQLSYLNPSCCGVNTNSMHPDGNVSYGQVFTKQVVDAVRQGPHWNDTLILLTMDESGGFHDHVPSPLAVPTDNLSYTETKSGQTYTFHFDRLGGRIPTFLISAYSPKGHIENMGTNPKTGGVEAYSATSVLKTLGLLWDLDDLTPRVSNSPTFDHLIGPTMRTDVPLILTPPLPFPNDT